MCKHIVVETRYIYELWVLEGYKMQNRPSDSLVVIGQWPPCYLIDEFLLVFYFYCVSIEIL